MGGIKAKAAPLRGRRGASDCVDVGRRDSQKIYHTQPKHARSSVPGQIDCYDGLLWRGTIRQHHGKYIAVDQHGHQIGSHSSQQAAAAAVYAAGRRGAQ